MIVLDSRSSMALALMVLPFVLSNRIKCERPTEDADCQACVNKQLHCVASCKWHAQAP